VRCFVAALYSRPSRVGDWLATALIKYVRVRGRRSQLVLVDYEERATNCGRGLGKDSISTPRFELICVKTRLFQGQGQHSRLTGMPSRHVTQPLNLNLNRTYSSRRGVEHEHRVSIFMIASSFLGGNLSVFVIMIYHKAKIYEARIYRDKFRLPRLGRGYPSPMHQTPSYVFLDSPNNTAILRRLS
jgi:hypothetical protein